MYGSWDMEHNRLDFLSFWTFLPFYPITWKIKILNKWKNTWRYYHFTLSTIKDNPRCMVSEIWSMTDRIFCHFGLCFALLLPLPNRSKNQNFEKMNKSPEDIIILHRCTKNHDHMLQCSWDTCTMDVTFIFYFGLFFTFLFPKPKKSKFLKKEKKAWRYHHFTHVCQKLWSRDVWFLRYGVQQTDRQTGRKADRRMEKVTYRSGCPN